MASSRRGFMATGLAAGLAIAGSAMLPGRAWAQTTLSPDAALQALLDGNKRFVDKKLKSFGVDLAALRTSTTDKQEPFAAVLSCADSRVPVELVFDESIGQLFVTRVAGNLATPVVGPSVRHPAKAGNHSYAIALFGHGFPLSRE